MELALLAVALLLGLFGLVFWGIADACRREEEQWLEAIDDAFSCRASDSIADRLFLQSMGEK